MGFLDVNSGTLNLPPDLTPTPTLKEACMPTMMLLQTAVTHQTMHTEQISAPSGSFSKINPSGMPIEYMQWASTAPVASAKRAYEQQITSRPVALLLSQSYMQIAAAQ